MEEVKNDYIEKALTELISILGVKEFIDEKKLISLIHLKKTKECIKAIALDLGLPIEITISWVPKGYRPSTNSNASDGFYSTHLVKTDKNNRGTGGITAQVFIPPNLPLYGSPSMVNFPISVRLSENCAENPSTLIGVMAHELSHILLRSLWHKEKENEFYTDLTAMLLGFAEIMKTGRRVIKTSTSTERGFLSSTTTTHTETTTYGYLSDDNFYFAFGKITEILRRQKSERKKMLNRLGQFKKRLDKAEKLVAYFIKYLEYLDKNLNKKISKEDGPKISAFHQSGYADGFQSIVKRERVGLEDALKFIENLKDYTARNMEAMQRYKTQLKSANEELKKAHILFKKDVNILKKYVGFLHRLRLRFVL